MCVGLGRQLQEAESILADENADKPIDALLLVARNWLRKISQTLFFLLVWVEESAMAASGNF